MATGNIKHRERVKVTPEMAKEWLNRNTHNRDIRPQHVEKIARDILLGEWVYNGDPFRFDTKGVMIDGQHRALAIVATGVPVEADIKEGFDPGVQEVVDTNRRTRSLKDILKLRGETSTTSLAAAINLIYRWESGYIRNKAENNPTHGQAVKFLEDHPEVRDSCLVGQKVHNSLPISASIVAACDYVFSKLDPNDTEDFWHACVTGFYLNGEAAGTQSGPYRLRKYLEAEDRGKHRVEQLVKHAVVVKAWNAYRRGADIKLLSWKQGGSQRENFPEVI